MGARGDRLLQIAIDAEVLFKHLVAARAVPLSNALDRGGGIGDRSPHMSIGIFGNGFGNLVGLLRFRP